MAEFLRDDFAGANGVTLTGYNSGWSTIGSSGLARIQDQRAYHAGSTAAIYARTDIPAPSADYSVSCDVISAATTGSPSAGPCGRMNGSAQTLYQARYVRGTGIVLAKFINGTAQTIDSTGFTLNSGETVNIRLEMIGTALKVYLNGAATPAISNTDSSITDPGFPGLRFATANTNLVYIDNLVGDTAGGSAQSFTYAAIGGFAMAGAAAQSRARTLTPTGGLQFSGAATVSTSLGAKVLQVVAAGGIAFSGIAQRIVSAARVAAGGVIFGGAAVVANSDIVARGAALIRRRTRPRQPVSRR